MKKALLLILFIATGCIHQRIYYDGYDHGWFIETTYKDYSRTWYYTNKLDTAKYLKQEKEVAEYMKEQLKNK